MALSLVPNCQCWAWFAWASLVELRSGQWAIEPGLVLNFWASQQQPPLPHQLQLEQRLFLQASQEPTAHCQNWKPWHILVNVKAPCANYALFQPFGAGSMENIKFARLILNKASKNSHPSQKKIYRPPDIEQVMTYWKIWWSCWMPLILDHSMHTAQWSAVCKVWLEQVLGTPVSGLEHPPPYAASY